jgi:uncharacterized protein YbcI
MAGSPESGATALQAVSNALVKLHKEQFGRGPTNARTYFAGPDALVCVLFDALLPAELKMVDVGEDLRVRESRLAFQTATETDFVTAVEGIVRRKVSAFGSSLDPHANVVFETFAFEPRETNGSG